MPLLNTAFIIFFVLTYVNSAVIHGESASDSKQWITNYDTYKPNIVALDDRILHVGLHENAVHITSMDGSLINVCNFTLSPNNKIIKPTVVRPVALGNGKIVVRTLMSQSVAEYHSPSDSPAWDLFIIVDPLECLSIKTLEVYNKGWERDVSAVVPYHDSFDVFYRKSSMKNDIENQVLKVPRRFNDQAEPINLDHHFGLETDILGFHIQTIKPYETSEGYICTLVSRFDNVMSLQRLDSKFQLIKETNVEPWVNAMAITDDIVNLCYINANRKDLNKYTTATCSLYHLEDLSHRASIKLHEPKSENGEILRPEIVKMIKLPIEATVVAIAFKHPGMSEDKGHTSDYYLQRINADGSTADAVHVGTYTSFFDLMSVVSVGDDEVCFAVVSEIEPRFGFKNPRSNVSSKCFSMSR